jgi:hypothetical protein
LEVGAVVDDRAAPFIIDAAVDIRWMVFSAGNWRSFKIV